MNLWVATKNAHKAKEIADLLPSVNIKTLLDIEGFPDIPENGSSYAENAEIKARALFNIIKEPVFSDDSGLEVDALNGAPGINSARYAGEITNHQNNTNKLLQALKDIPIEKRTARFKCLIIYIDKNGESHQFEGTLEGFISKCNNGKGGFGYDPIFYVPEKRCTVAQLSDKEKNNISHRAQAIKKLQAYLFPP